MLQVHLTINGERVGSLEIQNIGAGDETTCGYQYKLMPGNREGMVKHERKNGAWKLLLAILEKEFKPAGEPISVPPPTNSYGPDGGPKSTGGRKSLPTTYEGLVKLGFESAGEGACKGCGAPLLWWKTPKGKKMPTDRDTLVSHHITCPKVDQFRKRT